MGNTSIDCTRMSHVACLEPEPEPEFESTKDDYYACVSDCVGSLGVVTSINSAIVYSACAVVPAACPVFHAANVTAIVGTCALACDDLTNPPITR